MKLSIKKKYQQGTVDYYEKANDQKRGMLDAQYEYGLDNSIDRAEQQVMGSFQPAQQRFQDVNPVQSPRLVSPFTAQGSYSPTISQYVGSTAPMQMSLMNLNRTYDKANDYVPNLVNPPESMEEDTPYRNKLREEYTAKTQDIARQMAEGKLTPREGWKANKAVIQKFKTDRQIEAYENNLGKYKNNRAMSQKLLMDNKITEGQHTTLDKINRSLYSIQGGVGDKPDEYGNYKGINLINPANYVDLVEKGNKIIQNWTPEQRAIAEAFVTGDGYIRENNGSVKYITESEAAKPILNAFKNDAQLMEYVNQQALITGYNEAEAQGLTGVEALRYAQNKALAKRNAIVGESADLSTTKVVHRQEEMKRAMEADPLFMQSRRFAREDEKEKRLSELNEVDTATFNSGVENPFKNISDSDFTSKSNTINPNFFTRESKETGKKSYYMMAGNRQVEVSKQVYDQSQAKWAKDNAKSIQTKEQEIKANTEKVENAYRALKGGIPKGTTTKQMLAEVNKYYETLQNVVQKGFSQADPDALTKVAKTNFSNARFTLPSGTIVTYPELVKELRSKSIIPSDVKDSEVANWMEKNYKVRSVVGSNFDKANPKAGYNAQITGGYEVIQTLDNNTSSALQGSTQHIQKSMDITNPNYYTPTAVNTPQGTLYIRNVKGMPGYVEQVDNRGNIIVGQKGKNYFPTSDILGLEIHNAGLSNRQIRPNASDKESYPIVPKYLQELEEEGN